MHVLRLENLRNFLPSKDSIVVLTLIAWAAIVTSAHRLSQGLQVGTWHSWLTFSLWTNAESHGTIVYDE